MTNNITTVGEVNVRLFGALGNGSAADGPAIILADAAGSTLLFPAGTYLISSSMTISSPCRFLAGSQLSLAAGVTVTFNGTLSAPIAQIFSGAGLVSFNPATTSVGYPEWWGAVTYAATSYPVTSPVNSAPAIQAAVNALKITQLQGADYYITAPISMLSSNRSLLGVASNQNGNAGGSRIIIPSATIDGVVVGPASQPSGGPTQNWIEHVTVAHLTIKRTVAPTSIQNGGAGSVSGFQTSPTGLRLRWAVTCYIDDVVSIDSSNGFYTTGSVHCYYRYCQALRSVGTNSSAWDYYQGFSQDNTASFGYDSGNASLYYIYCSVFATGSAFPAGTSGIYTYGGFTDTFIHGMETSGLQVGLSCNGAGTADTGYSAEDLKITACVLDGCTVDGILINGTNNTTNVLIADCYVAPTGTGAGIEITQSNGLVAITGNQILSSTGSSAKGIWVHNGAFGVSSMNNIITDCAYPVIYNGAGLCRTEDNISNVHVSAVCGVSMSNDTYRCIVKPIMKGGSAAISGKGIQLDSTCNYNSLDPSGIDPGCLLSSSPANKIVYGSTQITVTGTFGTANLASGIMG